MILLYQMGKVGSTSVDHALYSKGIKVIHAHWMQNDFPMGEFPTLKPDLVKSIREKKNNYKVITLVRDPLRRNISAFFENLSKYTDKYRELSAKQLQDIFTNGYNIHYPDEWFELELGDLFDIDFSKKFDHSSGYKIYKNILVIRLEDANRCLSEALQNFLKIKNVKMLNKNVFGERHNGTFLGDKYREFIKSNFPEKFIDDNYNLKYCKYFYTKEEIERFKERWFGNVSKMEDIL